MFATFYYQTCRYHGAWCRRVNLIFYIRAWAKQAVDLSRDPPALCLLCGSTPHSQRRRLHRSVDYQETERIHHISSPELTVEANCVVFASEIWRAYYVMDALTVVKYGFIINHLSYYIYGAHITWDRRHMNFTASQITSISTFCSPSCSGQWEMKQETRVPYYWPLEMGMINYQVFLHKGTMKRRMFPCHDVYLKQRHINYPNKLR